MEFAVKLVIVFVWLSGCYGLHVVSPRWGRSIHMDGIGLSTGAVRCFCNLPVCVSWGYMCKTDVGCFSDLVDQVDVSRARHGCLDLADALPKGRQSLCQNQPHGGHHLADQTKYSEGHDDQQRRPNSLLLCCRKDMCNHIDSPESRLSHQQLSVVTTPNEHEDSRPLIGMQLSPGGGAFAALSGFGDSGSVESGGNVPAPAPAAAERLAIWFRAATIAVPICGAVILLMLIALAVRILRTDSQIERSSKQSMKQSAFVPLLLPARNAGISPLTFIATPSGHPGSPGQWVNHLHHNMTESGGKNIKNAAMNAVCQQSTVLPNLIDLNKDSCGPTNNCNMFASTPTGSVCSFAPKLNYKTAVASFNFLSNENTPADI